MGGEVCVTLFLKFMCPNTSCPCLSGVTLVMMLVSVLVILFLAYALRLSQLFHSWSELVCNGLDVCIR